MKLCNFKRSLSLAICLLAMTVGLVFTGFTTKTYAVDDGMCSDGTEHSFTVEDMDAEGALYKDATCTSSAVYFKSCSKCGQVSSNPENTFESGEYMLHIDEDEDGFCDNETLVIINVHSEQLLSGYEFIYLEIYDEETKKWNAVYGREIQSDTEGYFQLSFNVKDGVKYRVKSKLVDVNITGVTGSVESEIIAGEYTLQDMHSFIDANVNVPEGDIWIGDNGYTVGNYTLDSFQQLLPEELLQESVVHIAYDSSNRIIHDVSTTDIKICFCVSNTVKDIIIENVERNVIDENPSITIESRDFTNLINISGNLTNSENNPKDVIIYNCCFEANKLEYGSLTVTSSATATFGSIGNMENVTVQNGSSLTVSGTLEENVTWKSLTMQSNGKIDAPGIGVNVTDAVTVMNDTCVLKSLSAGDGVMLTNGGKLQLTTIGNMGNVTVQFASSLTASGTLEENVTWKSLTMQSNGKIDAPRIGVNVTDAVTVMHDTCALKSLSAGGDVIVTNSATLQLTTIGNMGNVTVQNASSLTASGTLEENVTWKSLTMQSNGKIDAPRIGVNVTDAVTVMHDTCALKSLSAGGDVIVTNSATLQLTTIGNMGNVTVQNGSSLTASGTLEENVTWKSLTMQYGGKIDAPGIGVNVTDAVTVMNDTCVLKSLSAGDDVMLTSEGKLQLTTIGNMGNVTVQNNSSLTASGTLEENVTWKSLTMQYGGKIDAPGIGVNVTDAVTVMNDTCVLKSLSAGDDVMLTSEGKLQLTTIGNMGNVTVQNNSSLTASGTLEENVTWKSLTMQYGGKIDAPGIGVNVTDAVTVMNDTCVLKSLSAGGDVIVTYSATLQLTTIGNMGNVTVQNTSSLTVSGTLEENVTWKSLTMQRGGKIDAPGIGVNVTDAVTVMHDTCNLKALSSVVSIELSESGKLNVETIGSIDNLTLSNGGILAINNNFLPETVWKNVSINTGARVNAITVESDITINNLSMEFGSQLILPHVAITGNEINLSGLLVANTIICDILVQTDHYYSKIFCDKLQLEDVNSVLYKGVINNIEVVDGDISDVLGTGIVPYNITAGFEYDCIDGMDKFSYGDVTGEAINSDSDITGPIKLMEKTVIKIGDYPTRNYYGEIIEEPQYSDFFSNNCMTPTSDWVFEWYNSDGELLEELPVEIGEYTLRIIIPAFDFYMEGSEDFTVTIKKPSEIVEPEIPEIDSLSCSIVLVNREGYEYSLDGINWQDSNVFTHIAAGEYTVYQRVKATEEYYESEYTILQVMVGNHSFVDEHGDADASKEKCDVCGILNIAYEGLDIKASDAVYNGTELTAVITGIDAENYNVTGNVNIAAGTYTIVLTGINDYYGTIEIPWTIKKAIPVYTIPTAINAVCGDKLSSLIIQIADTDTPGEFVWVTDGETILVGGKEGVLYTAKFVPEDTDNYEVVTDIMITVFVRHDFADEYTVDKKPTVNEEGYKSRHCNNCDATTDVTVISKLPSGWVKNENIWYYYSLTDGTMMTGWQKIDGNWYYLGTSGAMATGWQKIDGNWYYLRTSGAMATGWEKVDGNWYYLRTSGAMATGWEKVDGNWYYLESNGKMAANKWVDSVYYVKSNGVMATNEWVDQGRYYVGADGKWVSNKIKAGWKQNATGWWYDNGDSTYPTSTWKSIDGDWYYFNASGYIVTGWFADGGSWYYFESNGKMATGWKLVDGKWYYLESNGKMAANKWVNNVYYVKSNGVMATNEWVDRGRYYVGADGKWVPGKSA